MRIYRTENWVVVNIGVLYMNDSDDEGVELNCFEL